MPFRDGGYYTQPQCNLKRLYVDIFIKPTVGAAYQRKRPQPPQSHADKDTKQKTDIIKFIVIKVLLTS